MKKIIIILILCSSYIMSNAQFVYPKIQVTQLLGLPESATPSIGTSSSAVKWMMYNTTTNKVQVWNGTAFVDVSSTGADYIRNSTVQQVSSNFNIDGSGIIGGSLTVNGTGNAYIRGRTSIGQTSGLVAQLGVKSETDATIAFFSRANSATQSADIMQVQNSSGGAELSVTAGGNVGIGTTGISPLTKLQIEDETAQDPLMYSKFSNTATSAGGLYTGRARGTRSAPSATVSGDRLVNYLSRGYNGTSYNGYTLGIIGFAGENYSSTSNNGSYLSFETTANGTNTRSEKLRILGDGAIRIATVPVTSASAYDIVTRNQSTGNLEKILSSSLGTGTVTSITPGIGFNSSTPITTSGTLNLDTVTTISGVASKTFVINGLTAKQNTLTLTTSGTSGAATLTGSTLNIPNYAAGTNYWSRTSNVLSTANANDIITLGSNFGGGTSVVYATGSSGTNGITGQSDTQAGVIGRGTGTTGIGGSFESALNSGSGGATIQVLSNGTGDIAMFSSKISGVVTNQVYVRNNGLVEYIVDKSSLYGSRSVPDVAYVQSLTNKYPYLSKTANYTVLTTDWANTNTLTITVDASAGAVTITLPAASTTAGKIINIKKMDSSINTVTVNGGGTNIDGTSTSVITMQYGNAMIQSISTQYITL